MQCGPIEKCGAYPLDFLHCSRCTENNSRFHTVRMFPGARSIVFGPSQTRTINGLALVQMLDRPQRLGLTVFFDKKNIFKRKVEKISFLTGKKIHRLSSLSSAFTTAFGGDCQEPSSAPFIPLILGCFPHTASLPWCRRRWCLSVPSARLPPSLPPPAAEVCFWLITDSILDPKKILYACYMRALFLVYFLATTNAT